MGETRVDLLHLLEDLRDAYPGATEETILTEIVANSLDSGATTVTIATDPAASALTIADDGIGMRRRELARYHDIAASTKTRGEGIGFAGVGIKLGLLLCEGVLTETRRGKSHVATQWHLASPALDVGSLLSRTDHPASRAWRRKAAPLPCRYSFQSPCGATLFR